MNIFQMYQLKFFTYAYVSTEFLGLFNFEILVALSTSMQRLLNFAILLLFERRVFELIIRRNATMKKKALLEFPRYLLAILPK